MEILSSRRLTGIFSSCVSSSERKKKVRMREIWISIFLSKNDLETDLDLGANLDLEADLKRNSKRSQFGS